MEPGSDEYYMRMALAEAEKAAARDEVPVGVVVVAGAPGGAGPIIGSGSAGSNDGVMGAAGVGTSVIAGGIVIARAHNLTETLNDPTAHAEMQAITAATSYLGGKYLTDCTLYVTVEPCVMCAGALAWSQVSAIVWGAGDPKKGYTTTGASILHPKTQVRSGVLAEECSAIMKKFFRKKRE
jgi:tRNA(adenine34) deaminase